MFGPIADGIHYNLFARLITEVANKFIGIPLFCFFDDCGSMVPSGLFAAALGLFIMLL